MPKERILEGIKFKYSGLIDFRVFYKAIKDFWDSKGFDYIEKKHEEKVKEDGSRDVKLEWYCEKEVTDYAKYIYELEIEAEGLKIVDVNGKKMEHVDSLSVSLNGDLEFDYERFFGDKPFNIFLRALYEKYIVGSEVKEHKGKVAEIGLEFIDMVKDLTASYKV